MIKLLAINSALLEVPVHEPHIRGSNWLAVVNVDATMPGGLSRRFLAKGKGECFYDIHNLALFDAVEFGADYTTSVGRKRPKRWYGVVMAITDDHILVEPCKSGAKAVLRAKEARTSIEDQRTAIQVKRDSLIQQAALLEKEIESLQQMDRPEAKAP